MSHKIAKAQRKAERNAATPNDMHLLIVESNRQRRRANAHTLKDTSRPHNRSASTRREGKVRKAKDLLRRGPLIVERPIRALWRAKFGKNVAVLIEFVRRYIRWSKSEMDAAAQ